MVTRGPKTSGADHSVMRELNRSLVLDLVKKHSPISRASIAKAASLAKPTVSAIVDDLLTQGLVSEIGIGATTTGGGRPPILLEFNARSQFIVGIQVGIKRTNFVVADALGEELERVETPTPHGEPTDALNEMVESIRSVLSAAGAPRSKLAAVGVCMPGLVDMNSGTCLLAPNLGWRDVPVAEILTQALGVPAYVVNTADAAAVLESIDGAAQGARDVVLVYVGRGVGAGILTEGRLVHGGAGLAGEVGHCHVPGATRECGCGKIGCLETVVDGPAIARAATEAIEAGRKTSIHAADGQELRAEDVSDAAQDGDELAIEILGNAGRELGNAVAWLINLLNPEVILIGGGVANAGEALMGPLREAAHLHSLPQASERVAIKPWTLGRDAGVRGAVLVAMQYVETYYRVIFQG